MKIKKSTEPIEEGHFLAHFHKIDAAVPPLTHDPWIIPLISVTILHPKFINSCSHAFSLISDIFSRRTGTSVRHQIMSLPWEPKKLATLSKKNKIMWWQIPRRERGAGGFPSKPTEYLISIYQIKYIKTPCEALPTCLSQLQTSIIIWIVSIRSPPDL